MKRDWVEICLAGTELDDAGAADLDRRIDEEPDNLELRVRRLGFLSFRNLPRGRDVLWLVTHHPEIDLAGFAPFPREIEPELYVRIAGMWDDLVQRFPENSTYREQAARFASMDDLLRAEALYREGAALQPNEPKWREHLGDVLMLRSGNAETSERARTLAADALREFQQALELDSWDFGRHGLQISIAQAAVAAGNAEIAAAAAHSLLSEAERFRHTWQYGNAVHWGHVVLGKVAFMNGDLETASRQLVLGGRTPGSPQLNSFGPDFELANDLLQRGDSAAVADYIEECKRFWEMSYGALDRWLDQISRGERPTLTRHES